MRFFGVCFSHLMGFLNPFVLLALAAAAIPLVVHLFNFRRPQRVDFSSLQFLREMERRAMRRVRVRQWLLLALRTLAILALVLAFARPTYTSAWEAAFERGPASVALVVDNSLSTTLRDEGGAVLDQIKALAAALAEAAQPGDELALVPMGAAPGEPPVTSETAAPVLDALAGLQPSPGAETATAALARAASVLEGAAHPRRQIFLLSDLQASTLADSGRTPLPEGVEVTLMPLGARAHTNAAVVDARVESRIVAPGRPVRISATLVRYGRRAEDVAAQVLLDGEPVAESAADLEPGRPTTLNFTVTPPRPGWLAGEVRLSGDDAAWDDVRYFTLHVPPPRRVLVVRGAGQRSDFVTLALQIAAEEGGLDVSEVSEDALAASDLAGFDAVVLVGPRDLSSGEVGALVRYAEAGGGLLLFPHPEPVAASYDALFRALGGGRLAGFAGALGGPAVAGTTGADLEHPLFEGMLTQTPGSGGLESPEIAFAARYQPGQGDESTLVSLTTGGPFLHEIRRGRSALLFFAVAPDPRWSDLPTRGLFPPLLLRAVTYLASDEPEGEGGAAGLVVRRAGTVRVEGAEAGAPVRLVGPGGLDLAPPARAVSGGLLLDVDETVGQPGVYDVRQGERLLRRVAFNHDPRESDVRTLDPDEAARRLEAATGRRVRVLDARGGAGLEAAEAMGRERAGVPLWSVFLAIALAALLAETVVAARWKEAKVAA